MDAKIIDEIIGIVGKEKVLASPEDRQCYAYDARTDGVIPDLVVFPSSAEDVSGNTETCKPLSFSRNSERAGHGSYRRLHSALRRCCPRFFKNEPYSGDRHENLIAVVEPGVINFDLQQEAAKYGLFYPPDPASYKYSSIGGNVAECAGGPNSLKYGVTRDYVLGVEAVKPTGEILNTGVRTMKGVVGYDIARLFVGSEGTLGVITKIILKLIPLPEAKATILALFQEVEEAAEAVSAIIAAKVIPSTIEFMDKASIQCSEKASPMGLPEGIGGLLLIEVDGDSVSIVPQVEKVRNIVNAKRAIQCNVTDDPKESDKLWQARRALSQALYTVNPVKIAEDVVVPRSHIPTLIRALEAMGQKFGIPILSFGHAGDGNFHVNIMIKDTPEERAKAEEAVKEIFAEAIRLGGTLSGEHGIGTSKAPILEWSSRRKSLRP